MNRVVLDLSHWNVVTDWNAIARAGVLGVIHKASEGDYNVDGTFADRRRSAEAAGLKFGAYHFGTNDPVDAQVAKFLSTLGPAIADDDVLLALDFEDYGSASMSIDQAAQWIAQVEAKTGRPNGVVVYSGNRIKEALGSKVDPFFAARRLWLAQYGTTPDVPPTWATYWLWQFTDGSKGPDPHTCPGVTGPVDGDHFDGTADELFDQWSGIAASTGPSPDTGVVVTIRLTLPAGSTVDDVVVDFE